MKLNFDLLDNSRSTLVPTSEFNAEINAHGSYHAERFVLRLSPVARAELQKHSGNLSIKDDVKFATAQAMSTQLHETIHWWQHIGSIAGLIAAIYRPGRRDAIS